MGGGGAGGAPLWRQLHVDPQRLTEYNLNLRLVSDERGVGWGAPAARRPAAPHRDVVGFVIAIVLIENKSNANISVKGHPCKLKRDPVDKCFTFAVAARDCSGARGARAGGGGGGGRRGGGGGGGRGGAARRPAALPGALRRQAVRRQQDQR